MEIRLAKPASRAGAGAWLGLAWQKVVLSLDSIKAEPARLKMPVKSD